MKRIYLLIMTVLMLTMLLALQPSRADAAYTYTYDAAGRLIKVTLNDGSKISYTYDTAGNILQEALSIRRTLDEAIRILQVLARIQPSTAVDSKSDASADGKIGLEDAIYLLQKLADLRP